MNATRACIIGQVAKMMEGADKSIKADEYY